MFFNTDAAVQETCKLLKEAYLSEKSQPLWTGAPELLQFDRYLGKIVEYIDTEERLKNIDYSSQFQTLEHFSSEIYTVSIKSFVNAVTMAKEEDRFFLIKGPPGSGRTALLQRVCAFWAQGFCLRKFILVLWLDLKAHSSAPSDVSLSTLLSYTLPYGSHLSSIQQWLERHGMQDILIMIDGVEGYIHNEWQPFLQFLAGTKASVVLTATLSTPIWYQAQCHSQYMYMNLCEYNLFGLSQDQILKQVIHHYWHDSRAEEFLMYISEAHDIRALCSSPPHLAAVLFVFDTMGTRDLPNTWTQLFTILTHCLSMLSSLSDNDSHVSLASKAYTVTFTNSTLQWHPGYANFFTRVTPPYQTLVNTHENCYFTLPLLQHYLCAKYIHSLPLDQHGPALNEETIPLHVRRFYVGLCSSPERVETVLTSNTLLNAACISEVAVTRVQNLITSTLTFENQWLTSFDIHRIFQAVHNSQLLCKLEFSNCAFGPLTFEMMEKWLRSYFILPSGGAVQELRCLHVCMCVCVHACASVCICACIDVCVCVFYEYM